MLNIISLGAGVQSSTMALMAAHGEITPMPDCAIFADTQSEGEATYNHLEFLKDKLPFPIEIVTAGNLTENIFANRTLSGHKFQDVPWRTRSGLGRRQCTTQYKILPLYKRLRQLGATADNPVHFWIAISLDEAHRMKPSRVGYVINEFPLLDKRVNRLQCLRWLSERGYPKPPKSSCVFCPYKGNDEWKELSSTDFARAVAVDNIIRSFGVEQYAHRDLVPLSSADLRSAEEAGQLSLFGEECEGMCGV